MPMGIYFMTGDLDKNINRNDVVVFCPSKDLLNFFSERNYISKKIIGSCEGGFSPFVKHVIALRGDKIEIENNELYLNGTLIKNSQIFDTDSIGRRMSRLKNGFKKVLSKDEIFVFGDESIRSLDSRYMGLVHTSSVLSKAKLIWRF